MENLKKELVEMVEIFEYFQIPEERQKNIITSGVYFEFHRNESVRLNCFRFANLLKMCKSINSEFDVNQMFNDLNNRRDKNYESLVKLFIEMEGKEKEGQKRLIKTPSK